MDAEALKGIGQGTGQADCIACCTMLTEKLDLYVSPDGDDGNNGLTPGTAKKTIQEAINSTGHYILLKPRLGIVINLAEGEYLENISVDFRSHCKSIHLQGTSTGSSKIIGSLCVEYSGTLYLNNLYFETTKTMGIRSFFGGVISNRDVTLCNSAENGWLVNAEFGGFIEFAGSTTVLTKKRSDFLLSSAGNSHVTFFGPINFSNCDAAYTLLAYRNATIMIYTNGHFSGTCSGTKYLVKQNGVITLEISTTIPGNSQGIVQTGGVYSSR